MKTVLVTGSSGQLGRCLQKIASNDFDFDWLFLNSDECNITSKCDIHNVFSSKRIDFCINCAAYTNVEGAEKEVENAFLINADAVKILAQVCEQNSSVLIHISTDYVFDGKSAEDYSENSKTHPLNVYGTSKLKGEHFIQEITSRFYIIRTSWLYSEYGHNFYKTILKKGEEGANLNITTSQTGTPTNANDLAKFLIFLIRENLNSYGVYHFSNIGKTTWYGFAKEILQLQGSLDKIILKEDNSYETIAKRPENSVLSKDKILSTFNYSIKDWKEALQDLYKETQ